MIIGDMEIRLRADIARLQRDMDSARQVVGNATAGMERAANAAKGAIASIAAGLGVQELGRMVDEYAKFTAQLKLASTSQREYAAAYADVKRISTQSTQGLQQTGVLYARIANGTRELGVAQKQVAAITETVNLSLLVSGATASEAASAQMQLSQAFASGTLRGEEFNAVNEAAPRLMLALADGIGVPVGALKKMAEEGQITSKIMSDVLPNALNKLREEAKEVQTISGAFTVLRNNVMEFVGMQAQASGVVAALSGALTLLAENLALVAGTVMTLAVAKLGSIIGEWVTSTYRQVAAAAALRAANIASAEAEVASTAAKLAQLSSTQAMIVVAREEAMAKLASSNANITSARTAMVSAEAAGAQSFALRTLRLATADLAVAEAQRTAMLAELAILGRQQAAVSAQITAATVAQTAAQAGLNAATTAGVGVAGLASRALGFLGGPIGAVITLLGIGAMAWSHWSNKATESEKEVARTLAEETDDYIGNLQRQIDKLKERNELAGKRMVSGTAPTTDDEKKREAVIAEINRIGNDTTLDIAAKTEIMRVWGARLNTIDQDIAKRATEQATAKDFAFTEKYAEWLGKNGTAAQKEAYDLAELRKEYGRVTPEMEKWVKAKYADKGAAQAVKAEATAYQNLITSIREKSAANALELQGYNKLSDSQKMTIKLDEAIASGKNKLTPAHVAETRALIAKVATQEEAIESNAFYLAQAEQQAQLSAAAIKAAGDEADRNEELALTFGKSKLAIEQMTLARLQEKLAQADTSQGYTREIMELEAVIDAKKRSVVAMGELEGLEALQKATEKARADQVQLWDSIEKTAHDTFISIFDSGKSAFDRLKDALKNGLYELLYQMTVKKWIVNISSQTSGSGGLGQLGSMMGGSEGGGAGSMFSNASSLISMGKTIYSGFTGGITGTLGGWASTAGSMFGSTAVSSFGAGLSAAGGNTGMAAMYASASTSGNLAAGASAGMSAGTYAIPIAGWIAAGMALSNNLYKKGWDVNNGTVNGLGKAVNAPMFLANNVLKGLGLSNSAANIFAGMGPISKLFGRKNPEIESQGVQGTISGAGFEGNNYANILEKGGIFRSDKRYTQSAALSADQDTGFDTTVKAMIEAAKGFASTLGLEASVIDGYNKAIKVQLGADEAKNQEAITKMFGEVGDELSARLLPSLGNFTAAGETASATLQRLVTNYATIDEALTAIGTSFGAVGVSSLGAREKLLEANGGLEAFATGTAFFHQNFLSEADRNAPVLKAVTEQMAALGHAGVDTRDEFKQLVLDLTNSGALATEAGAAQYAALMKVQTGFAQVYPVMDAVADSAENVATKLADVNAGYQNQIDELLKAQMSPSDRRSLEVRGMDASTVALYDRVQALQLEASALEQQKGLQDELNQLTLTSAQQLELQRAALDESNRSLFDQIQLETRAKSVRDERLGLQNELDQLTMSSVELLGLQRAALDESNRALFDQVQAIKGQTAAAEASKAAIEASKAAAAGLLGGVDSAFSVLQSVVNRQKEALQEEISIRTKSVQSIQSLSQSLRSTLDGMTVQGREADDRQSAQAQIQAALAITKASGKLPSAEDLRNALSVASKGSPEMFATQQDYLRDFYATRAGIEDLGVLADDALSVEEWSLKKLEDQVKQYDQMLERQQQQIDVLKGISTTGLSIEQAMKGLAAAMEAAKANPVVSAGAAITGAYQQHLGRAPDAAGLEWWKDAAAGGAPISQIVDGIANSAEANLNKLYESVLGRAPDAAGLAFWMNAYGPTMDAAEQADFLKASKPEIEAIKAGKQDEFLKLRGFAVGTNQVLYDTPAYIHKDERIMPAADNRELMRRLSSPSENNSALEAAVDRLTQEVASLRDAALRTANATEGTASNTGQLADQFENVTDGGNAMRVEVLA